VSSESAQRRGDDPPEEPRAKYVDPTAVAAQLSISVRHAERLARDGAFGPRLVLGHRTVRVQQSGVDAFLRRAERGA
jgi:hypothetical protein